MKNVLITAFNVLMVCLMVRPAAALEPQSDGLFVRVVDVGAGLCCVVCMPGNQYMIYDAGNFEDLGGSAIKAIKKLVPVQSNLELLVLSHTDSDHNGAVKAICSSYHVRRIVHPGLPRDTMTMKKARSAIAREVKKDHAEEMNLSKSSLTPGQQFQFGDTTVTLVCGFEKPPSDWDINGDSEFNNAGSIIVRVQFKGKSVLFCGDAVGRHLGAPDTGAIATEKFMLDHAATVPINSDVLIAPHHGADNASSTVFIKAVHPQKVIFSAGHKFRHPRAVTAQRYLNGFGLASSDLFRTDRDDNEGNEEWGPPGHSPDKIGDDDVDILITKTGTLQVAYRTP